MKKIVQRTIDLILAFILVIPAAILLIVLFIIDKAADMRTYKPKAF